MNPSQRNIRNSPLPLLTALLLAACAIPLAHPAAAPASSEWRVTAESTFASKYMAHGYNFGGDDEPSFQPALTLTTPLQWLTFTAWTAYPFDRDFDDHDEMDFLLKLGWLFNKGERVAIDLHGYLDYWLLPNRKVPHKGGRERLTGGKFNFGFSFPGLWRNGGVAVVPGYNMFCWVPEHSDMLDNGAVHEFSVAARWESAGPGAGGKPVAWQAQALAGYNDGAFGSHPGWSHCVAGLAASVPLGPFTVTPSLSHQWSFESSVNPKNEFLGTVTLSFAF
jgi:hypothetical protein